MKIHYTNKLIILIIFLLTKNTYHSFAQFGDRFSNPQITVKIDHPPYLGLKINKVAFNPASGNCADQIVEAIIGDFVSNNVEVIDRNNLKAILAEHNFNNSGYVDQSSAVAMGKILGPSALLTVKVLRCQTEIKDNLYQKEKKHNYEKNYDYEVTAYISRTRVFLKVSIQTADLTTGRIFAARVLEYSPVKENKSYDGRPETPAEFDVQQTAFNELQIDVHRMFFPWSERTLLYYMDDKTCGLKEAYQALKSGNTEEAFILSRQNLTTCNTLSDAKDKNISHANYNLGMTFFIKNEYDSALVYLQEAQRLRPGDITTDAISKCNIAKSLSIAMQKIEDKTTLEAERKASASQKETEEKTSNTMTNTDVITMSQQKLPNSIIIQKIKNTTCNFDLSTNGIINLTKSGVNEEVVNVMLEKK